MTSSSTKLRVAIVGGGPAGIYAADILTRADSRPDVAVSVDIWSGSPRPTAWSVRSRPDHPRIRRSSRRSSGCSPSPGYGCSATSSTASTSSLEDLRGYYDAVVFATGAMADRDLGIPGEEHSHGAADFVSWYDAHPDVPRTWPLDAPSVAVLGAGNVALDVARVLAKPADEMLTTDIPAHVYEGLRSKTTTDVHVFARRGPAYAKFSPMELRELSHSPTVEVIVHPEGFDVDPHGMEHIGKHKAQKMVLDTLANWVGREPAGKPHRIHLHFAEAPIEILAAADQAGGVTTLRTERTRSLGDGTVEGTGQVTNWDVQAVYRAVGYRARRCPACRSTTVLP